MKKENSFPNWFKNSLIAIGVLSLFEIVRDDFAEYVPQFALLFPIFLLFILLSTRASSEGESSGKGKYYLNISLCIIGFFTLILLVDYKTYIERAGKLIMGGYTFFLTENFNIKILIYIFIILYFTIFGSYMSFKVKFRIEFFEGIDAFQSGKRIWIDIARPIPKGQDISFIRSPQHIEEQKIEALKFFDRAIEKGYSNPEVFSLRGNCLYDFGFYFDAIEDYNKAIKSNPERGIASDYYMRSVIRESIFDYEGSLTDIDEAIRLSKSEEDDNELWHSYAKETTGFNTATEFYDWHRYIMKLSLNNNKRNIANRTAELEKIKRR